MNPLHCLFLCSWLPSHNSPAPPPPPRSIWLRQIAPAYRRFSGIFQILNMTHQSLKYIFNNFRLLNNKVRVEHKYLWNKPGLSVNLKLSTFSYQSNYKVYHFDSQTTVNISDDLLKAVDLAKLHVKPKNIFNILYNSLNFKWSKCK